MNTSSLIEIFKPGRHVAMNGKVVEFTEADLKAAIAAYDPAVYEAPIVIGHPKTEDASYGWAKSLSFSDEGKVCAETHQVDLAFSELVKEGRYKKVSATWYEPDAPNNPKPGTYYLKHIGFLGAAAPAIKGLKTVQFSENESGVLEFADWDQMTIAAGFRRLREWIISKFGIEEANEVLPAYEIESLQINAVNDDRDKNVYFSETESREGEPMTPQEIARMKELETTNASLTAANTSLTAENQTLKGSVASFAEAQVKARHDEHVSFAEGLVSAGKLLPVDKDSTVAMLDNLAATESTLEFGEGDGKQMQSPLAIYKGQLEKAQKIVHFGEHVKGDDLPGDQLTDTQVADRARVYKNKIDTGGGHVSFAEAVDVVRAGKDQ